MKKLILIFLSFNLSLFLKAQNIEWLSFEQAIAQFNKEPKEMFIDVYTNWCGWCKRMDQTTFKEPEVVKLLSGNYYCVKVDAEMRNDLIFNNDTLKFIKFGRSGAHELALRLLNGQMQYPSYVVLDKKLAIKKTIKGYKSGYQLKTALSSTPITRPK